MTRHHLKQSFVIFEDSTGKGSRSSMAVSPFSAQSLRWHGLSISPQACLSPGAVKRLVPRNRSPTKKRHSIYLQSEGRFGH